MIGRRTFYPTDKMREYVNQIMDTGRLSYGPFSKEFERRFAELHGCEYAVLSNSGTSSLLVALQTLKELHGWQDGDEVIVPAITFVATVNVVLQAGLKPVLVDVEKDYYGINPNKIGEVYQRGITKAIIPVHTFGQPVNLAATKDVVYLGGLWWIEDSCETMFVSAEDEYGRYQPVGSWGDIACFSTYMAHLITTGVGGIATTNNPDYAKVMRSLVNHGMAYSDLSKDGDFQPMKNKRDFVFERIGHSFRVTEFEAALGLAQLDTWQEMIDRRQGNASFFTRRLKDLQEHLQLPAIRPNTQHAFMMYPIVCKQDGVRDRLVQHLNKAGIGTRRMLPLVSQPCYKGLWSPNDYPVARWIDDNGYYIGCHPHLSQDDLEYIVKIHEEFFSEI